MSSAPLRLLENSRWRPFGVTLGNHSTAGELTVPLVGTAAVWVPGTVYLLMTGAWPKAIVLAVWGAAVVSGVDNVVRPRLVAGPYG